MGAWRLKNELMTLDAQYPFRPASFVAILSAFLAGYFNVGSLYLLGLPLLPFAISLLILWTTKAPILRKTFATLIAMLFIPIGFFMWVWWNGITLNWKW